MNKKVTSTLELRKRLEGEGSGVFFALKLHGGAFSKKEVRR